MLRRMLLRSLSVRRGRSLTAVLALTVAAAVATTVLGLYHDAGDKLRQEFRNFGANATMAVRGGETLPGSELRATLHEGDAAVLFAYDTAKLGDGRPVVIVGTDLAAARKMNPWWVVTPAVSDPGVGGVHAMAGKNVGAGALWLRVRGKVMEVRPAAVLSTGGEEDQRVYFPLETFVALTGMQATTAEIYLAGSAEQVEAKMASLRAMFPQAEVRPVRQIADAETEVLGKTRAVLLWAAVIIGVLVALCVMATLTASVLERKKDFAVMKALGATQRTVNLIFAGEALALGAAAAVAGFALGAVALMVIGRVNFHALVPPPLALFPGIALGTVSLALVSALAPLARLQRLEPAMMLKGE